MSLGLISGIAFALIAVCLAALCLFDRQRFWSIAEPKYKSPRAPQNLPRREAPQVPLNRYHRLSFRPRD